MFKISKVAICLLALLSCKPGFSGSAKQPPLPHFQTVVDAQFKCEKKILNEIPWGKHVNQLAPKAWSVISNLKVEEKENRKEKPRKGKTRTFKVVFTGWGYFECGEKVLGLDKITGRPWTSFPVFKYDFDDSTKIDETDDDPESAYQEGWDYFLLNTRTTDGTPPPDTMGRPCLVELDKLLKDESAIELNKLCAGESKERREFTKKEIKRAIDFWKMNVKK